MAMAFRLSPRIAGWLLLPVLACSDRGPTEPATSAAPGSADLEAATAGRAGRSAARVVPPRASASSRLEGAWGGDGVGLTISSDDVAIEFDCAAGSIDGPFLTDAEGRFVLIGSWWFTPPVIFDGWLPEKRRARYSGVVENGTMSLKVVLLDDNQFLGAFMLAFRHLACCAASRPVERRD